MKKGGYQIIDLKNFDIHNGNSVTIKGIYNILKEVKKPLLLSGIKVNKVKQQDQYIIPETSENNFLIVIKLYDTSTTCAATVKPDDTVTFAMA